ncbi:PTS lactose/cellobiose transporter subunit IIA [Breznakia pachnodae]|uniref:PTS system cellobiose-specific IIA component n=1 Tax=Breznakia pachnodae TaxID=265178 RepID=A0ABU0E2Q0_9FIRM|nr:PTS lactose/cellobiose transporter subunit IIA [Breznakia pachnodae]MDQ0361173.1 PTS system cellobiose-specific IIA component [Breznakia pachnodae]
MDKQVQDNELVEVAMQIILHAGDARMKTEEALEQTKNFDFAGAKEKLVEAKECIRKAHHAQTQIIQDETRGKTYPPSLLFNHAQDTLMTIMSELNLANSMVELFEILDKKYSKDGGNNE